MRARDPKYLPAKAFVRIMRGSLRPVPPFGRLRADPEHESGPPLAAWKPPVSCAAIPRERSGAAVSRATGDNQNTIEVHSVQSLPSYR